MQRYNPTELRKPPKPGTHKHTAPTSFSMSPKKAFWTEYCADVAIERGDFEGARAHLLTATDGTTRHSRNTTALAKLITLPFAEIRYALHKKRTAIDTELTKSADDVYGLLAEAIEISVGALKYAKSGYEAAQHVGSISELCILGLGARRFSRNRRSVIVPSSIKDDFQGNGHGTDAIGYNLASPAATAHQLQIKTSGFYGETVARTVTPIVVGGLLPYHCSSHLDARSLPNLIITELSGSSTDQSIAALDHAEQALHRQVFGVNANR